MLQVIRKCYKSFSCTGTISALSDKVALKYYCGSPLNAKTTISSILVYLIGESEEPTKIFRQDFGPEGRNWSPGPPEYDRMLNE
jgi:hypothetical protein